MKVVLKINENQYKADLNSPLDISIPISNGEENPNCYYAKEVTFSTIRSGDFVGSVAEGGSVNYQELLITPHGNGTHTETYGHLVEDNDATISKLVNTVHCSAELISLTPRIVDGDRILVFDDFIKAIKYHTQAIIIRTLPNKNNKLTFNYSGTNPPFLDPKIAYWMNENSIQHLLVDLPSVDKEVDGGKLLAHCAFWGLPDTIRKESTITELVYIDNEISDGLYLLNIQLLNIKMDASPSRPILFKLNEC